MLFISQRLDNNYSYNYIILKMSSPSESKSSGYATEPTLKPQVSATVGLIQPFLEDLKGVEGVTVSETIIEDGHKMVVRIDTDTEIETRKKRVSLSVRSGTVGFIGDSHQFTRLSNEELHSGELIARTFEETSLNPLVVDIPQEIR